MVDLSAMSTDTENNPTHKSGNGRKHFTNNFYLKHRLMKPGGNQSSVYDHILFKNRKLTLLKFEVFEGV